MKFKFEENEIVFLNNHFTQLALQSIINKDRSSRRLIKKLQNKFQLNAVWVELKSSESDLIEQHCYMARDYFERQKKDNDNEDDVKVFDETIKIIDGIMNKMEDRHESN